MDNSNQNLYSTPSFSVIEPKKKRKWIIFLIVSIVIIALALGVYFYFLFFHETGPEYRQVYRLVPEKISQSATIRIYLPPGISPEQAKENIEFFPEIEGNWVASKKNSKLLTWIEKYFKASASEEQEEVIYYKPDQDLELDRYYSVQLATVDGGAIKADFLSVENPEIIAVFPEQGSEVPEDSEITIVFNRPMVPLTTLGELEEKNVPVTITPKTEGRFKWITTRNLQFIPKDGLRSSSNYEVKIKGGMQSMDGLKIGGSQTSFTTRNLRYAGISSGQLIYDQPISIKFNQAVDLDKTEKEISLVNNSTGASVSFIAEYGGDKDEEEETSSVGGFFNFFADVDKLGFFDFLGSGNKKSGTDKTIVEIYNYKDKFGRKRLWDFENNYTVTINKAYPLEGDINIEEIKSASLNVTSAIKNISVESYRTSWASLDFFDPQGKVWVEFYEDINLNKSRIEAPNLKNIGYDLKCKDEVKYTSGSVECEKVEDKRKIYLEFDSDAIGFSETIEINFKKIVNTDGLTINQDPISRFLVSYPKFKVLKTIPDNGGQSASLTELTICSNSPIMAPAKEDYNDYFSANLEYELNYWGKSRRITYYNSECDFNQFQTKISYGLMPLSNYSLNLHLEDVFAQKKDISLNFDTGPMPSQYLNFYQLQDNYVVATPNEKKLTFAAQNMSYLNVDICKLSAVNFLYYLENKPSAYDSLTSIGNCSQRVQDTIDLPERYWFKNYFQIDVSDYFSDPMGHYVITFYHPNYVNRYWESGQYVDKKIYPRHYLSVTNLGAAEKKVNLETFGYGYYDELNQEQLQKVNNLYWVTSLDNLEPVTGAKVSLYKESPFSLLGSYYTGTDGIAKTDAFYDIEGAVISKGDDSTVISSRNSSINWASYAYSAEKVYLYTDKPIYRPAQDVFIKGIYRVGYDGDYETLAGETIDLRVYNSKNDEILQRELTISSFGTFNTKVSLDSGAPLGMYRYCVNDKNCSYFDVQEYQPAAFEVKLDAEEAEYISKDTVDINVEANYYFGVPVEGGKVSYTISSQDYYFDRFSGEYYNFGSGWDYWSPYYGDKYLLRGETSLSEDGTAKISQKLDFEALFKDEDDRKSKIITVDVTVTNLEGKSISGQQSFIVHAGEFYLGIKPDKWLLSKNENFNLRIKSVDTQGNQLRAKNLDLKLYKVEWVYSKRQEAGGGYSYKWERKEELIKEHDFSTDKNGDYSYELSISEEGVYEAVAEGRDDRGNLIRSSHDLYVWGTGRASVMPSTDTTLELEAVKTNLNVGNIAEVIIKSPYPEATALISTERGKVFDYQIRKIQGNIYKYEFPIKEEYLPNVYLSVLLQSSDPEVKFGEVKFNINTETRELDVEVISDKQHYLPGEEVKLNIAAKDYNGQPVSAELSLAVVDLSVLALKGNVKKDPLVFFYSGFPLTVNTASNIKNILVEKEIATKGGGGSEADSDLARKSRGDFRETAFWQAVVRTDENGRAELKFVLPDNLTTWQTETIAVTEDTKLGIDYGEFMTRKRLMVVPIKPRFIVPGDSFYIGAKIFNQTSETQKLEIKIDSDTLVFEDNIQKTGIREGETGTYYFKATAPDNIESGSHQFVLSAKSEDVEDTVIQEIEIVPNDTYEVTATANYTSQSNTKEYVYLPEEILKDKGELTIQTSATLAVFLSDGLNYLLSFPYGCAEQIASKLNAIAIVKRGLNLPNLADKFDLEKVNLGGVEYTIDEAVDVGLSDLYNKQNFDGGFSFWGGSVSGFYLSLDILESFNNLKLAGYSVNEQTVQRLRDYLVSKLLDSRLRYYEDKDLLILTSRVLAESSPETFNSILRARITNIADDYTYLQDKASSAALVNLLILLEEANFSNSLVSRVAEIIDNRIDIDSRGAFLEPNDNHSWEYFETTIKDTALYLKSLSIREKKDARLDKIIRWLLNSKYKDGSWGSTNNTLAAIGGLVEFLEWQGETESKFDLDILINQETKQEFQFNKDTILDQLNDVTALSDLNFGSNNIVEFQKDDKNLRTNNLYYDLSLKYYLPLESIAPRDEGFSIIRTVHQLDDQKNEKPVSETKVGEVLRVHLQVTVPKIRKFVAIEDFIPAGMEIVNLDLATEQKSLRLQETELQGRELRPDFTEFYDDRALFYKDELKPGVYEFDYFVRALTKGEFAYLPAKISEMYFPENFGRTSASYFTIK